MSKIKINGNIEVEGAFKFSAKMDTASNPPLVDISGTLEIDGDYISEDIAEIESDRYILKGVRVYKEEYSTEADFITYFFKAKSYGL